MNAHFANKITDQVQLAEVNEHISTCARRGLYTSDCLQNFPTVSTKLLNGLRDLGYKIEDCESPNKILISWENPRKVVTHLG